MAELAPLHLRDFHNLRERDVVFTFAEVLKTNHASAVIDFHDRVVKVARSDFLKSDFYNLILRPSGWERALLVKVGRRGQPLGTMQLGRLEIF